MIWLFGILPLITILSSAQEFKKINVNISEPTFPLPKFWKSTGFSPPVSHTRGVEDYLMSNEVKVNLRLISSLPAQGIEFVRIHWLLSLLVLKDDGTIKWDLLDSVLENIVGNELKPVLELMGNSTFLVNRKPGSRFWYELCKQVVQRYSDKYGENEVSQWKFELWNEPDLKMYNALNFSLEGYLEYAEGCVGGLRAGLSSVQVGGPAGVFKAPRSHPLCWGFLNHCNASHNRCNLDYISFHKKGYGTSWKILDGTLKMREVLTRNYSNLAGLPIVNDSSHSLRMLFRADLLLLLCVSVSAAVVYHVGYFRRSPTVIACSFYPKTSTVVIDGLGGSEADILTGWWRPEDWRGDARYAAAVVRTIFLFKPHLKTSNISRISIDNGFLNIPPNYFNQRTLFTRFPSQDGTDMFVQKPIYGAMGLMAMLGEEEFLTMIKQDESLSVFATCKKNGATSEILSLSVLVGTSELKRSTNKTYTKLKFKLLLSKSWINARYVIYEINNDLPSPKTIWESEGSPSTFNKSFLTTLQQQQEPHAIRWGLINVDTFRISTIVPHPSVTLLHVCRYSETIPGKVRRVRAFNMSFNDVLLTWKEDPTDTRCIKTFVVEHSKPNDNIYKRVNLVDIVFNNFNYIYLNSTMTGEEGTRGSYRVAAVDYWGKEGEYSDPILYTR